MVDKKEENEMTQEDQDTSEVSETTEDSQEDVLSTLLGEESSTTTDKSEEDVRPEEKPIEASATPEPAAPLSEVSEAEDSEAEESEAEESEAEDDTQEPDEVVLAEEESEPSEEQSDADIEVEEESEPSEAIETIVDERYENIDGIAAFFDHPDELMHAAEMARDEGFDVWDAYSPFPIHGIEDAMGTGRSWLPWVTFAAGGTGFLLANMLQFGTLSFDWPMIIGGKPYAPWPSFVPVMFELTVLLGGVTTAIVMFIASGCFRKPKIIDPEITNDRFVLWVSSEDSKYNPTYVTDFMKQLDPVEIRPVKF